MKYLHITCKSIKILLIPLKETVKLKYSLVHGIAKTLLKRAGIFWFLRMLKRKIELDEKKKF
jgi:hypothetical protein